MFSAPRISRDSVSHKTTPRYFKEFLNCSTWGMGARILPLLDALELDECASLVTLTSTPGGKASSRMFCGAPALSQYNLVLAACNHESFDNHM